MKKIILIVLLIFSSNALGEKNIINIAIVNDKIITNIDLANEIKFLKLFEGNIKDPEKIKQTAINNLINDILKDQEISSNNLKSNDDLIKKNYNNIISKFSNQKITLTKILENKIYDKIKIEINWNNLITKKYYWSININLSEIEEKIKNEKKTRSPKEILDYKEKLVSIEKDKKLSLYSQNHLNKIKKESLIRFF